MVTLINGLGIYKNIFSKEPINYQTQSLGDFIIDFKLIAKKNKFRILNSYDRGLTHNDIDKKELPCWRPNAIFGNRANSINTDRIIMGSGLFFFDLDFKKQINLEYVYDEEIKKLNSLLNGYKEHLLLNFKENTLALYKSVTRTGLHFIFQGISVANADEYKKAWNIYKNYIYDTFPYLQGDVIDKACCNINRASYIGSDDTPFLNEGLMIPLKLDGLEGIKTFTPVQKEFAKVQCLIKSNRTEKGRRIIASIDSMDVELSNITYIAENYNTEIKLNVKGKEEVRTLIAYVIELGVPLLFPNNWVRGKITIGRRHKTITKLTADFLFLNGYNLLDNIPLVKHFFTNHIYPKVQQSESNKYTLEEMYKNIESTLNAKLLPSSTKDLRRYECLVTDNDLKTKLASSEARNISKKYRASIRSRRMKLIINVLIALNDYEKIVLKKIYDDGKELFVALCNLKSYNNFKLFAQRNGVTVSSLHNTNKYINTGFEYTDVKQIIKEINKDERNTAKYTDVKHFK